MNRENFASASGPDYIRAMYANTHDGKLTIGDEDNGMEILGIDWNEQSMEEVIAYFETLLAALTRLGQMIAGETVPGELREVYDTYIKPYPDHGMDPEMLYDISMKAELNMPLTEEEAELLDKHIDWLRENALTRLPFNRCNPSPVIQRARRYVRLMQLNAPAMVMNIEARYLAEELVFYCCLAE